MTRRHPQSTAQLERRILQMAAGAQGLTWRRLHDYRPYITGDDDEEEKVEAA